MDREVLLELKEFLTERMVDNMSTKDLEEYVCLLYTSDAADE